MSLGQDRGGTSAVTLEVEGDRVGVSALDETNALLVRTTPTAWKSIRDVIERLDVMPLQVHIEAQVAQVQLTGELSYGVQWFIENGASGVPGLPGLDLAVNPSLPRSWSTYGGSVTAAAARLDAVQERRGGDHQRPDRLGRALALDPSVFVRNNAEAEFNVGDRIPVSTVSVNPIPAATTASPRCSTRRPAPSSDVRPR